MAVFLLALFPILFIFDTRLGVLALVVAIVLLYRGKTAKAVKKVRAEREERTEKTWEDPWGPGKADAQ